MTNTSLEDELLAELMGETTTQPKEQDADINDLVPSKIIMTDRCLQLGHLIGPATKKLDGRALEVGGFYIGKISENHITITDFIIPKDLYVTEGSITIAEQFPAAVDVVKKRNAHKKNPAHILTMFHVHPFTGVNAGLYHSKADDDSLASLVNKLAKTTRRIYDCSYNLFDQLPTNQVSGHTVTYTGNPESDATLNIVLPQQEKITELVTSLGMNLSEQEVSHLVTRILTQASIKGRQPRLVNFAYSLVFNNNAGGPYIKMGVEDETVLSKKSTYFTGDKIPLQVIDVGINIPTQEEVETIIAENVIFPPKYQGKRKFFGIPLPGRAKHPQPTTGYPIPTDGSLPDYEWSTYVTGRNSVPSASAYPTGNAATCPTGTCPPKSPVAKINHATLGEQEALELYLQSIPEKVLHFVTALYGYLAQYREPECKYSQIVDAILDEFDSLKPWATVTSHPSMTPSHNLKGQAYVPPESLSEIMQAYDLVPDGDAVYKPEMLSKAFFPLTTMVKGLEASLARDKYRRDTENFMDNFSLARTLTEQNTALEMYKALFGPTHQVSSTNLPVQNLPKPTPPNHNPSGPNSDGSDDV